MAEVNRPHQASVDGRLAACSFQPGKLRISRCGPGFQRHAQAARRTLTLKGFPDNGSATASGSRADDPIDELDQVIREPDSNLLAHPITGRNGSAGVATVLERSDREGVPGV